MPSSAVGPYSGYTTVGQALDAYISDHGGKLQVGHAAGSTSDYAVASLNFVAFDSSVMLSQLDQAGNLTPETFNAIVGHELGHLIFGTQDALVADATLTSAQQVSTWNMQMNQANFDNLGSSVKFENSLVHQNYPSYALRGAYDGVMLNSGSIHQALQGQTNFTNGAHIDFVRLAFDGYNNDIDISARTDNPNVLILGISGNDTIEGGSGHNWLYGGAGDDYLKGGVLSDYLYGQDGSDHEEGGEGNDTLIGGAGSDTLLGGADNDTLVAAHGEGLIFDKTVTSQTYGASSDQDLLDGGSGDNTLIANSIGIEHLFGGAGADTFILRSGTIDVTGGGGSDIVLIDSGANAHSVILLDSTPEGQLKFIYNNHSYSAFFGTASSPNSDTYVQKDFSGNIYATYHWNGTAGDDCSISLADGITVDIPHFNQDDWGIFLSPWIS